MVVKTTSILMFVRVAYPNCIHGFWLLENTFFLIFPNIVLMKLVQEMYKFGGSNTLRKSFKNTKLHSELRNFPN